MTFTDDNLDSLSANLVKTLIELQNEPETKQ